MLHKNVSTGIVTVFDSKGKRIEVKPGEKFDVDRRVEGQGIVPLEEKKIDKEKDKKDFNRRNDKK